jgi:2,5-dihydroxypyridine 5,6-dioxygenase
MQERIEWKWIEAFTETFRLSAVEPGDSVAILAETQSRRINVELAELALQRLGARVFRIEIPTPTNEAPVPIRCTGSSVALQGIKPVLSALRDSSLVADLTVEGMMHSPETPEILGAGSRILYVSNEHPELLERCVPDASLKAKVEAGIGKIRAAKTMRVTSDAGTDLTIALEGAFAGGGWGACDTPGTLDHWPGGLVACNPPAGSVNGVLVMDEGDINLTFKRYLSQPVRLRIEDDFAVAVEGEGLDADLMRSYFDAWQDENAYAVSHVGWGMNPRARWDSLVMYDKAQSNGTEQRAYAGNFLYSTGANEFVGRHTLGHFDLPIGHCSLWLDDEQIVDRGRLLGDLA